MVRASRDDGRTWPEARSIHRGPAAYSCLARLPNDRVGCLFEAGGESPYERIVLATFALVALTDGDPGAGKN